MLVLAESELRSDPVDAAIGGHEQRFDVAAVFRVVDLSELLPNGTIFNFLGGAFQDDGFVGFFSADDDARLSGNILGFASARAGTEPEGVLPPNSPDQHEVRAAIGARRGDPVVVGFL